MVGFVKSTYERACLTGVALAATTGEAQKPTKSSLPNICSLFPSLTLTLTHCNAVTHKTSNQRACYLPQRKRATSATQGQGGATYRTPLTTHRDHEKIRAPAATLFATSTKSPPSTRQTSPPLEIALANPPHHNTRSFESAPLHVEVHRWAPRL